MMFGRSAAANDNDNKKKKENTETETETKRKKGQRNGVGKAGQYFVAAQSPLPATPLTAL